MPENPRHELDPEGACHYLGVPKGHKYPFRLVYFKKEEGMDTFTAFMTPPGYELDDVGFNEPGFHPIVKELGNNWRGLTRDRKDSFLGIINMEEFFQPHELDFETVSGVYVCEDENNDLYFMRRHSLLRLPLKAKIPGPDICPCSCGSLWEPRWTGSCGNIHSTNIPSFMWYPVNNDLLDAGYSHKWFPVCIGTWTYQWFSGIYHIEGHVWDYQDQWTWSQHIILLVNSYQTATACKWREPPVFTHAKCPGLEMAEWYYGLRSGYTISYGTHTNDPNYAWTGGWISRFYREHANNWQKLGKAGTACLTMNPYAPRIGDLDKPSWEENSPFQYYEDFPSTDPADGEIPGLPEGAVQPPGGFPPININVALEFDGPFDGILRPCEECTCSETHIYFESCDENSYLD